MIFGKADAAYLAGFIDGEGCFGFYSRDSGPPRMIFAVGGRDEKLMRTIQKMFRALGLKLSWCCRADGTYMLQTERRSTLLHLIELVSPFMVDGTRKKAIAERILLTLSQPAPAGGAETISDPERDGIVHD